jgi:hypothetical protein
MQTSCTGSVGLEMSKPIIMPLADAFESAWCDLLFHVIRVLPSMDLAQDTTISTVGEASLANRILFLWSTRYEVQMFGVTVLQKRVPCMPVHVVRISRAFFVIG